MSEFMALLIGLVFAGMAVDSYHQNQKITPDQIERAQRICAPVGGLAYMKNGGDTVVCNGDYEVRFK